jgi:acyl carrier protein
MTAHSIAVHAALLKVASRHRPDVVLSPESDLVADLGLGSAEVLELVADLEDELDVIVPLNRLDRVRTVAELTLVVQDALAQGRP